MQDFDPDPLKASAFTPLALGQPVLALVAARAIEPDPCEVTVRPAVERRHDFASAVAEYERLAAAYPALGYVVTLLPKVSVAERLAFVVERVGTS